MRRCEASYVVVPSLWPTELANGLLVAERKKRIDPYGALALLRRLEVFDIRIEPASVSQQHSVIDLARRERLTVYDASYLDLAMRRLLPIATLDAALIKAAAAYEVAVV